MSGFQQFLGNIKLDLASGTSTSDEESSGSSCYGDHSGLPMPTKEEYRDYESIMIECANESLRDTIRTVCAADIAHFTGINRRKGCWPLQPNELLNYDDDFDEILKQEIGLITTTTRWVNPALSDLDENFQAERVQNTLKLMTDFLEQKYEESRYKKEILDPDEVFNAALQVGLNTE